ncbi:MAG: serine dehydratase [Planctomycetota bacterium]|nr:MAG: serine dehydratase [Planctomycetota bacterium]
MSQADPKPHLDLPVYADVLAAAKRIEGLAHRTPVLRSRSLDELAGMQIYCKCENFQRVGAFKFRGASNAVAMLPKALAAKGVVTHSSGNHAQALALAARTRGIPAYIVMPENAPAVKREAVLAYGGKVTLCAPSLAARESTCAAIQAETGASLIHPYDDARIIAGQGTACLELLDECRDLDTVLTPVGGGGLLAGACLVGAERGLPVFGAEPMGADDAYRSLKSGEWQPSIEPDTIADGLLTSLGQRNFALLRKLCAGIFRADDDEIRRALELVWQRMKIVVEPSAVLPLAVLLQDDSPLKGKKVGVIFSGGNLSLPWGEQAPNAAAAS